ncbi:MAG: hypothetical protein A2W31_05350 [Planctomycetes bacterium RBG_16_64_10]|nr:MAG: hypothetical protein A2W31_05350 [Planctomycetes bacterium RBG_16_64_10]
MMRRLWLALRVFFRTLFNGAVAEQAERLLDGTPETGPAVTVRVPGARPKAVAAPPVPTRSDAITLLASLQREARFVDFVQESLGNYSDAQIGAVARDVHRGCAEVLERLFAIRPLLAEHEDDPVDIPRGFDPGCYQLTGQVEGEPPFRGRLVHHGWRATTCKLATWSGSDAAARIVAPAEIQL